MLDRTEIASDNHADRLLGKANVVGVAGGGDKVLVYVESKLPLEELNDDDVVDEEVDGLATDVIEVGDLRPMLRPGASIGPANSGTGTFGGAVVDEFGNKYMLTNNHVAANSNRALALTPILHPGAADGPGSPVGSLARFEPIFFDRPNRIDAALVRADVELAGFDKRRTTTARVGWAVQKYGRTTGHTWGTVKGRNATVRINFGEQGVAQFTGQIITTRMLSPGDSGSVLLSKSGHPVGLCFAGSDTISIHNPINRVLRTLAVEFAE